MSQSSPSALDALLIKVVQQNGVVVTPVRPNVNFVGPGFTVVDNPSNPNGASTDVSRAEVAQTAAVSLAVLTGNVALTLVQQAAGYLVLGGAPSGNIVLQWPSPTQGQGWIVAATTGFTFGGHTVTLQANGNNWATVLSASGLWRVVYDGTRLYGSALTP